jgi:hypothetical protein
MKSLDAKKIAVAAAGAVLLGASLLAAAPIAPYGNTEVINANGKPVVQVVVGANAKASDGVAAANIAAVIGNLARKKVTVSAVLSGEPACTVAGAAGGSCAVTNEKATLEITVPGTQSVAGAYGFKTYLYGYVDTNVKSEDDQAKDGNDPLVITSDQFSAFADKKTKLTGTNDLTIKEKVSVETEQLPYFDTDKKKFKVTPDELKYIVSFEHDTWGGIPVCTKTAPMEDAGNTSAGALETACTAADTYLTERLRIPVKFLGAEWVITDMTANSSIKLAKESTKATVIKVGEGLQSGDYTVTLKGITAVSGTYPLGLASIEVTDKNGAVVLPAKTLDPAQASNEVSLSDGNKLTIKIYQLAPTYSLADQWAELAVISQEMELKNAKVDTESTKANYNWTSSLGWKKYKTTSGIENVLTNITLTRDSMPELFEGEGINLIGDPALYQFYMAGQTLNDANYQSLTMEVGGSSRTSTFYENETATTTTSLGSTYDLVCLWSDKKAFRNSDTSTSQVSDDRYKVCWSTDAAVPFFVDKPDKGLVRVAPVLGTTTSLIDTRSISCYNGTAWSTAAPANVTAFNMSNSVGNLVYNFNLAPGSAAAKTNATRLFVLNSSNVTDCGAGDFVVDTGGQLWGVNSSLYMPVTAPWPYDFVYGSLQFYLPDSAYNNSVITFNETDSSAITLQEYADKSTGTTLSVTKMKVKANSSSVSFKSTADSESKVSVNYYSPSAGDSGSVDREVGFVNQRGTKLVTRGTSKIELKVAEKTGELQYYLKSTGATVAAGGVSSVTKAKGESETIGDVVVKVKDITYTKGACSAEGGDCSATVGTVTAKLDTGETSKDMWVMYEMPATQRLVISDAETPTAQNLILVGGPLVNSVTKDTLADQAGVNIDTPGVKVVREFGNKIVVAGYTAADTDAAAAQFISDLISKA